MKVYVTFQRICHRSYAYIHSVVFGTVVCSVMIVTDTVAPTPFRQMNWVFSTCFENYHTVTVSRKAFGRDNRLILKIGVLIFYVHVIKEDLNLTVFAGFRYLSVYINVYKRIIYIRGLSKKFAEFLHNFCI